jgi:hypothetical protein
MRLGFNDGHDDITICSPPHIPVEHIEKFCVEFIEFVTV